MDFQTANRLLNYTSEMTGYEQALVAVIRDLQSRIRELEARNAQEVR